MGRPKKPDALRVVHGDHPERINPNPPRSPLGADAPPDHLDDFAREAWVRLVDRVGEMRLLTRADFDLILAYSTAYSDVRHATVAIAKEGHSVQGGQGAIKAHPLISQKNNGLRILVQIMGQLGMSPASRASLHAEPPREDDPLMDHINGRTPSQKPRPANDSKRGR